MPGDIYRAGEGESGQPSGAGVVGQRQAAGDLELSVDMVQVDLDRALAD